MYVQATLRDGTQVVSEFKSLKGIHKLSRAVLSGQKGFEVYEQTADTHPASGAPCLVRRFRVYNGRDIVCLEQVTPDGNGGFRPAHDIKSGARGLHTFTSDNLPEGATAGIGYPVEYDEGQLRRYVVIRAGGDGLEEVRHWLDPERHGYGYGSAPSFGNRGYDSVAAVSHDEEPDDDGDLPGDSDDDDEF